MENKNINKKAFLYLTLSIIVVSGWIFFDPVDWAVGATDTDQVTLSVAVSGAIALDCGADVDLGTLTPGTPVTGTSTCTTSTNAAAGYDLQVQRDDADTTMDKTDDAAVNIADKTAWDPTANAGNGNAASWTGTGLGFTVYASTATKSTTWWGTGTTETDANNLYAGFPSSYATIMDHDSYESSSTTVSVGYQLDTAATQAAGSYDGTITFQAVTKP